MDCSLKIGDTTAQRFVEVMIQSLSDKDKSGFAGVVVMGDYYQRVGELHETVGEDVKPAFVSETKQLHTQILQALNEKISDFVNLYPKAVENTFRAYQIQKYLVQTMKTFSRIPKYLVDKPTFNLVKLMYGGFLKLFGKQTQVMESVSSLTMWFIH